MRVSEWVSELRDAVGREWGGGVSVNRCSVQISTASRRSAQSPCPPPLTQTLNIVLYVSTSKALENDLHRWSAGVSSSSAAQKVRQRNNVKAQLCNSVPNPPLYKCALIVWGAGAGESLNALTLTHPPTHPPTHSLNHSPTHSPTGSLSHSRSPAHLHSPPTRTLTLCE